MQYIKNIIQLMRVKQWTKNAFVLAALVFSGKFFEIDTVIINGIGFIVFCMISSCVYIINDISDREKDRIHPKKCKRPIASGAVTIPQAIVLLLVLLILSCIGIYFLNIRFAIVAGLYFLMNLAYTFYLKNTPILDIMCIAMGFVFRALAGSFLVGDMVSPWLIVCTFLLALFIAIQKRKSEISVMANTEGTSRKVLQFYSHEMLRDMCSAIDSATIVSYCLYVLNSDHYILMMCTIPFVIYGLFRYQYLAHSGDMAESPELALLKDKPLLVDIALWGLTCLLAIYL